MILQKLFTSEFLFCCLFLCQTKADLFKGKATKQSELTGGWQWENNKIFTKNLRTTKLVEIIFSQKEGEIRLC